MFQTVECFQFCGSSSNMTACDVKALICVPQVKEEEEVTYSTVKTAVQTEADDDPSCLYSYVSKPK